MAENGRLLLHQRDDPICSRSGRATDQQRAHRAPDVPADTLPCTRDARLHGPKHDQYDAREQTRVDERDVRALDEEVRQERDQPPKEVSHPNRERGEIQALRRNFLCVSKAII